MCQPFCEKTKISIRNSILISLLGPSNQLPSTQSKGDLLLSLSRSLFLIFLPLSCSLLHGFPVLLDIDYNKNPTLSLPFCLFLWNHLFYTTNSFMSTCSVFDDPCPYPVRPSLQSPHLPPSLLHPLSPIFIWLGPSLPSTSFSSFFPVPSAWCDH